MNAPGGTLRFSVIVASRRRGRSLKRTLRAVRQLDHSAFEVIVVGDEAARSAVDDIGAGWVRFVAFDEPNLSAARNLGISASAGEICAFLDDDAIPEPTWLAHHQEALITREAAASVGYVRGPDGIGFQSRAALVDHEAETHELALIGDNPCVPELPSGRAVKLVGTNMAVRRDALAAVGGFDPAYRYFLDDADISLRLRLAGYGAAVVPLAEVHHALAASDLRMRNRAPKTLHETGRSTAIFLRRHPGADLGAIRASVASREWRRLERALAKGTIEPRDMNRLMTTLEEGWEDGQSALLPDRPDLAESSERFHRVAPWPPGHGVLTSRFFRRKAVLAQATEEMNAVGRRMSVFSYSLTSWPHLVRYTEDGVWLHTGGQFHGKGLGLHGFRWCRFASCVDDEIARVANRRGFNDAGSLLWAGAANL
ncbi:MAG: glycosyltransferase [Silicimonas sp.]|nr:glycosyltransferase [Silicimonas sp.]